MSDVRFGLRLLCRSPVSTLAIALLLALGIGAGTLMFSLFDAVVLRPLPVRRPDELVRMVQRLPVVGTYSAFPLAYYQTLHDHATTLAADFGEAGQYWHIAMTDPAPAEQISVRAVTPEFFDALGVHALYGRALTAGDARQDSGPPPAVLSYGFWRRRFAGDPHAIGRTIILREHHFVVTGIMPRDFHGLSADTTPDVRIPMRAFPLVTDLRTEFWELDLAGRLKPGVTRAQAQAECLAMWRAGVGTYFAGSPEQVRFEREAGMALDPLEKGFSILRDRFGEVLKWLMAAAVLLALLVCANIAGLLLARAAARRHEFAVRLAVGASPARIIRQMLLENSLLTVLAAVGGLCFAIALAPLLLSALPPIRDLGSTLVPLSVDVRLSWRIFFFLLGSSLAAMIIFTFIPAIAATHAGLDTILRGARSSRLWPGRRILITLQIALCTFLLAGAGLLARTFAELHSVDPGFDRDHVATFTVDWTTRPAQARPALLEALTTRVRQIPGVSSVAVSSKGVMRDRGFGATIAPAGQRTTAADFLNVSLNSVSPEYFDTMGMHILAGRALTIHDTPAAKPIPPVKAVVNQAFVRRFFPRVNPIGRLFGGGRGRDKAAGADYEIVGVVSDARYRSVREAIKPTFYPPWVDGDEFVVNVRTRVRPEWILQPVRKALASVDPSAAFLEVHTLAQEVDASMAGEKLTAALALSFGGLAALLAGVGIFGLLASVVTQRSREIGIRMALGASTLDVTAMIWRQMLAIVASGIVAGLAGTLMAAPWIRSMLYGVSPLDPKTLAAAAIFVAALAAAASVMPTVRALRLEPSRVLHE